MWACSSPMLAWVSVRLAGVYNETVFRSIDYIVAQAAAHRLKVGTRRRCLASHSKASSNGSTTAKGIACGSKAHLLHTPEPGTCDASGKSLACGPCAARKHPRTRGRGVQRGPDQAVHCAANSRHSAATSGLETPCVR
jgi:hypothetical protein